MADENRDHPEQKERSEKKVREDALSEKGEFGGASADEEEEFSVTDDEIDDIINLLDEGYVDALHKIADELSAADMADVIVKLRPDLRYQLIDVIEDHLDPEVYAYLPTDIRNDFLSTLSPKKIAAVITSLDSDDALNLISEFDDEKQQAVLKHLSRKMRLAVEEGLSFPERSAGRLMQRETVAIPEYWTIGKTIDYIRAMGPAMPDRFYDIYVINNDHHVLGAAPLDRVLRSPRATRIQDVMDDAIRTIHFETDQEEVAFLFRRADLISAPVIDDSGRLIGVITIDDIVDVIDQEAQEDILKLAGIEEGDIHRSTLTTARSRFSWLAVNLLTAILASIVIGFFEATLEQIVALAVLMPIVASMGGNAGTQAMTVAIRALATKELTSSNAMRVVFKELWVGCLNGIAFAILIGVIAAIWFASPILGAVIAAAMVVNLMVAGLSGILIPLVLHRMDIDPAPSAGVFLTTVTDVVGFFAFLGLATIYLI